MTFSVRECLHAYAATLEKTWQHDRSKTVGASEIGQCARKTWFAKHDAPRDEAYTDGFGARLRGNVIENEYWLPALRATLPEGALLLFAGEEQQTLVSGYLSATTDGLMVWPDSRCINLDNKSIDPRAHLQKEKPEHAFQVQTQMGLIREKTEYKPDISIISYIDASFWDKVTEFVVPFNERIYANAHVRAERIMTERDPLGLPPEGKMAGGDECKYCAWASHCAAVTVAGVPNEEQQLGHNVIERLHGLRDLEREAAAAKDEATIEHARAVEAIKQFLRERNTRRYKGSGWSVSYSTTAGRAALDIAAVEAAGIDLTPYYKTGKPSERLTIK